MFSCSSQVPRAADVLRSPAAPPEGAERSEAEAGQAAGPHQPAGPGPPAQVRFCRSPLIPGQTRGLRSLLVVQVSGGAGAAAAGLHGDAGGEDRRSSPRSGPGGGAGSAGGSHDVMAFPVRSSLTVSLSLLQDAAVTQLLARVVEVEGLSNRVLQRSRVDTAQWDDL